MTHEISVWSGHHWLTLLSSWHEFLARALQAPAFSCDAACALRMGTNLSTRERFNAFALRARQHACVALPSTRLHRVRVAHPRVE
jgi:hypothetical protein